jgi:hypothetical protein
MKTVIKVSKDNSKTTRVDNKTLEKRKKVFIKMVTRDFKDSLVKLGRE